MMLLLLIIGWITDKIQNRKMEQRRAEIRAALPVRDYSSGYRINHELFEKTRGCNATGKFNDIW